MANKTGILLINLGTPSRPDTHAVRKYLREFLNDPRVVDLAAVPRWLLVNLLIIPFRARASSRLYRSIWTPQGSPLLFHSEKLCQQLQQLLGPQRPVALAMRYGKPDIKSALDQLMQTGITQLKILPLFPQYSSAATGSAIEQALSLIKTHYNIPSIDVIHAFYQHPAYIQAMVQVMQPILTKQKPDYLLLSYHGLPERQIEKGEEQQFVNCDRQKACPSIGQHNRFCYRAQCYETSRLLTTALGLSSARVETSFQSRLGKTPWIKPYTDDTLKHLAKQGIKHLAIACPSFVADCLETLEEIAIRAKQQWLDAGGEQLTVIPCLNCHPSWVEAIAHITDETTNL